MAKTRADVIAQALRRLGIISANETADADAENFAGDTLDALFEELQGAQGITITWTLNTTPDNAFLALSNLLAVEIAPHYEIAAEPRSRALGRFRATQISDDRADRRDLDENGTISTAEIEADARAVYY